MNEVKTTHNEDIVGELKRGCPEILQTAEIDKPSYVCFRNALKAAELLHKHTIEHPESKKAVHCDVDVDGIASGMVLHREFIGLGCVGSVGFTINKNREHGIKALHSNWARQSGVQLLIIVDSSSNELGAIRTMPCDVIVLDHHVIDHNELTGETAGGEYVIVSNMVDGIDEENERLCDMLHIKNEADDSTIKTGEYLPKFVTNTDMSGCEVCYEFCRLFERLYGQRSIVADAMMYQWVGVSLLTDAIKTANKRNQWYIGKTLETGELEVALAQIKEGLDKYKRNLDKSFVQFKMAPAINCAIRAGSSLEALNIVLNYPKNISDLYKYREKQLRALEEAQRVTEEHETYVLLDITNSDKADSGFCGIISTKLVERTGKNACTYVVLSNGMCKGSFRGRYAGVDYLKQFNDFLPGAYAQGHDGAFGFELTADELHAVMESLPSMENQGAGQLEITAGHMPDELKGRLHIDDMMEFVRAGKLMELGLANARLSNKEEHRIIVPLSDAKEIPERSRGKVKTYNVLGLQCKAFEELNTEYIEIYPEYTRELQLYVRNLKLRK